MKRLFIALVLCFSLSGCGLISFSGITGNITASRETASTAGPLEGLSQFIETDLKAALAMAKASDDKPALQCYPVLIGLLESFGTDLASQTHAAGAVSVFQRARNLNHSTAQSDLAEQINMGCAALFISTTVDNARLLSKLTGIIGSGGGSLLGGLGR